MVEFVEFPKWLHHGKKDVLVQNADEEAAVLSEWNADAEDEPKPVPANALVHPAAEAAPAFNGADPAKFDHDGDGHPGGSRKGGWPKGKPRKSAGA